MNHCCRCRPARYFLFPLVVLLLMGFGGGWRALGGSVSKPIPLWPKGAPDEKGEIGRERDMTDSSMHLVAGKRVIRLGNVSEPTIVVYRPSRFKANGSAVVVCPGGAYRIVAMDLEVTEVCKWFNSLGVTAIALKYRVPKRTNDNEHILALQDVQRAVSLVRFNAKSWKIDPQRIGILGFSAGGHLTAHADGSFDKRMYENVDEADQVSCRPDFAMLVYPAYLYAKGTNIHLAPELKVATNTPPTFLAQTEDDVLGVESCICYYLALKAAKIPAEMHLYPVGGHGYGLRPSTNLVSTWPKRAEDWLRTLGVLEKKKQ